MAENIPAATEDEIERATKAIEEVLGRSLSLDVSDELYLLTPYADGFDGKATVAAIILAVAGVLRG